MASPLPACVGAVIGSLLAIAGVAVFERPTVLMYVWAAFWFGVLAGVAFQRLAP